MSRMREPTGREPVMSKTAKDSQATDMAAEGNVDKIREILFGQQMHQYDERFSVLEQRMRDEAKRITEQLEHRVSDLESAMSTQIGELRNALANEEATRAEASEGAAAITETLSKHVGAQVERLEQEHAAQAQSLRKALDEQTSQLRRALQALQSEMQSSLEQESQELRESKVNRDDLSSLLSDIAMRLGQNAAAEDES